jgi:hypothetical protein
VSKIIDSGQPAPKFTPDQIIERIREGRLMCSVIDNSDGAFFHTADNLTPMGIKVLIEVLEGGLETLRAQLRTPGRA